MLTTHLTYHKQKQSLATPHKQNEESATQGNQKKHSKQSKKRFTWAAVLCFCISLRTYTSSTSSNLLYTGTSWFTCVNWTFHHVYNHNIIYYIIIIILLCTRGLISTCSAWLIFNGSRGEGCCFPSPVLLASSSTNMEKLWAILSVFCDWFHSGFD